MHVGRPKLNSDTISVTIIISVHPRCHCQLSAVRLVLKPLLLDSSASCPYILLS